jgi:hypothetical protein
VHATLKARFLCPHNARITVSRRCIARMAEVTPLTLDSDYLCLPTLMLEFEVVTKRLPDSPSLASKIIFGLASFPSVAV